MSAPKNQTKQWKVPLKKGVEQRNINYRLDYQELSQTKKLSKKIAYMYSANCLEFCGYLTMNVAAVNAVQQLKLYVRKEVLKDMVEYNHNHTIKV